LRNPLTHDRIPPRQEGSLLVRRGAFDRRRYGRARRAPFATVRPRPTDGVVPLDGTTGRRLDNRRRSFGPGCGFVFRPPALARPPHIGRRVDDLAIVEYGFPVEGDVRIVRFDIPKHVRLERLAADAHAAGAAEDVQDPRTLTRAFAVPVHEVGGFVPAFVADHAEERHA